MLKNKIAMGSVFLFAFCLTSETLAEELKIADLPHIHAEILVDEPRLDLSVPSATGAQTVNKSHYQDAFIV